MDGYLLLEAVLGVILILSSFGVILTKKPVHSCLYFLLSLLTLAILYMQLNTEFVGLIQIFVYGGAILVLFMFVIILFQDAHEQIVHYSPMSSPYLLFLGAVCILSAFAFLGFKVMGLTSEKGDLSVDYGTIESIGKNLYVDYFFPFEVSVLLILVALVGALYIGKKAH